ncbi:hypothetical protein HERIO_2371 [Hepatospora eriocheir]|uniref:N-acetyltransferase ESCO zinc-finger domain-containing protein n=1 Tax=Hepatospora eriocheir TaxID=1081669 RepID=A0A1X0Q773_9MICR|nr:hypothetical protein HERIO_2371 [Hepatospora eriocheir]
MIEKFIQTVINCRNESIVYCSKCNLSYNRLNKNDLNFHTKIHGRENKIKKDQFKQLRLPFKNKESKIFLTENIYKIKSKLYFGEKCWIKINKFRNKFVITDESNDKGLEKKKLVYYFNELFK